jgi:hypothetical protein
MIKGNLVLLSGSDQLIYQRLQQSFGPAEWTVGSVDEKQIGNPLQIMRLLRREKAQVLAFGCRDLAQQRFQFWLSAFLCFSGAAQKLIIDEAGEFKRVNIFRFAFVDAPHFCVELIMSLWVLVRAWAYLALSHLSSNDK